MQDNHGEMEYLGNGKFRCSICGEEREYNPVLGRAVLTNDVGSTAIHSGHIGLFGTNINPESQILDKKDLANLKSYEDYIDKLLRED